MHSAQRPRTTQAWRTAFTTPRQFGQPAVGAAPCRTSPKKQHWSQRLGQFVLMVLACLLLTDSERGELPRPKMALHRKAETAFLLALSLLLVVLAALKDH